MPEARKVRIMLAAGAALEIVAIWFVHWIHTRGYVDTEVYRLGARAWLLGYDVYGSDLTPETPETGTLPFIYPPFAAILFTPLVWLSETGAIIAVAALSHLAILLTAYAMARSSEYFAPQRARVVAATALLLPFFTLLEPARETINYGQINLILMGLVAADCLLPRIFWPRGLLVGLAAGMKLTPLGFLLFFLLRRDLRALLTGIATFAATVLVGVLAAPEDAADWWLDEMWSTGNEFGAVYAGNLSLRSLIAKQEFTGWQLNALWAAGAVVLLVLATWGMRYALRTANTALALMINAVLVTLVSPISWSHHWVWAAPTFALLYAMGQRNGWLGVRQAVVICAVPFAIGPHWYLPYTQNRELDWTFSQQVVGNSYTLIGIGFLVTCAIAHFRFPPRGRPVDEPPQPPLAVAYHQRSST